MDVDSQSKISSVMSNQIDELYIYLKGHLETNRNNPFKKIVIIVPDLYLKAYLQSRLASEKAKVAMGFDILLPKEALEQIVDSFAEGPMPPFSSYLDLLIASSKVVSVMSEERTPAKQLQLARLVAQTAALDGWYAIRPKEQKVGELARLVIKQESLRLLTRDPHFLELPRNPSLDEILLFGISTLCDSYHQFFCRISSVIPTYYFILSPCMLFWNDICSDRELKKYQLFFREKQVAPLKQEAFYELCVDRCQLLANCGRIGREFAAQLEESVVQTAESYVAAGWAQHAPLFSSVLRSHALSERVSADTHPTLLGVLHACLLTLATKTEQKVELSHLDKTVQLHAAPTQLREVQVLYEQIVTYAKGLGRPLECGEIVVLAPDIDVYRPYIERLFSAAGCWQIFAEKKVEEQPLFSYFWQILSLPEANWSADALFALFECRNMCRKFDLEPEDLSSIYACMEEGLFQGSSTFGAFVDRMVYLWTSSSGSQGAFEIDGTLGKALGICIEVIRSLQRELEIASCEEGRTLEIWAALFDAIFTNYFEVDGSDKEVYLIRKALVRLKKSDTQCSFVHAKQFFKQAFEELLAREEMTVQQPLIFSSFGKITSFTANMVCLLGMTEGLFPRQDRAQLRESGFAWVGKEEPLQAAIDKYRFIEAVLAAKDTLYISYQSYSYEEKASLEPSQCVTDLLQTLDHSCHIANDLPSEKIGTAHRLDAYPAVAKQEIKQVVPIVHVEKKQLFEIDISYLLQVAKSPLRPYFHQELSLYLTEESRRRLDDPFTDVETMTLHLMKRKAFSLPEAEAEELFEKSTMAMPETLKRASISLFRDEVKELQRVAKEFGIDHKKVITVELALGLTEAKEVEPGSWRVPAPAVLIDGKTDVHITGRLDGLYCQGQLFFGSKSNESIIRSWPKSILSAYVAAHCNLPLAQDCYFFKDGKKVALTIDNPSGLLQQYVAYAAACKSTPSCLYPEWVPKLLTSESYQKEIKASSDPYLDFFLSRTPEEELAARWPIWRKSALALFSQGDFA
ncbi:MAG: exodeoxyribonuclease V subunit gamma [Verrucomicrobia bacterium]|nr:exodeoxyribonuclease V subunit gamma [Verrucomicrobiota bacterium]